MIFMYMLSVLVNFLKNYIKLKFSSIRLILLSSPTTKPKIILKLNGLLITKYSRGNIHSGNQLNQLVLQLAVMIL